MTRNQIFMSALSIALVTLLNSTAVLAQTQARPTWPVQCSTKPDAKRSALIEVEVTRTTVFSEATAIVPFFSLTDGISEVTLEFPAFTMSGPIEDGRSHLVIHLKPTVAAVNSSDIDELTLNLSYEFSESQLTLHDGSQFQLLCNFTDTN